MYLESGGKNDSGSETCSEEGLVKIDGDEDGAVGVEEEGVWVKDMGLLPLNSRIWG